MTNALMSHLLAAVWVVAGIMVLFGAAVAAGIWVLRGRRFTTAKAVVLLVLAAASVILAVRFVPEGFGRHGALAGAMTFLAILPAAGSFVFGYAGTRRRTLVTGPPR